MANVPPRKPRPIGARTALALVASLAGCAHPPPAAPPAQDERLISEAAAPATPVPAAPVCTAFVRPGVLRRSAVARAVDAGLGRWLGGVDVEQHRQGNRFRGWRIVRLHPEDPCYALVDLRPGDVVTRVNQRPLERPEQANAVFTGLRTAEAITVERQRAGATETITFRIEAD